MRFAKGKSSAVIKRRISSAAETHVYKFKARQGQFVEITLKPARVTDGGFTVLNSGGEEIGSDAPKTIDWESRFAATGE